jgi:hypothetical protein
MFEPLEHVTPCRRHEPGPDARRIDAILAPVEAHYQRINSQIVGNVATHHELLAKVNPILAPEPAYDRADIWRWAATAPDPDPYGA